MDEQIALPVEWKGTEHIFNTRLTKYGYTYIFHVEVDGQSIIFEPDEEQKYRAVLHYEEMQQNKKIDVALLEKIAQTIELLVT